MKADMPKAAAAYVAKHWLVFPVVANTKTPMTPNGYKDAATDPMQIVEWWAKTPAANIGLACAPSGVIALDFDPAKMDGDARALLATLLEDYPTAAQETPTGGTHLVYELPPDTALTNSRGDLPPGVDVRVNGYILLAPSGVTYHGDDAIAKGVADGHAGRYAWMDGRKPTQFPPQPLPDHILAMLRTKPVPTVEPKPSVPYTNGYGNGNGVDIAPYAQAALDRELDRLARAREGERNETLNRVAFSLGQLVAGGALPEMEVVQKVGDVALAIGLEENETARTIASGMRAGAQSARGVPETPRLIFRDKTGQPAPFAEAAHFTDMGNARRMHAVVQGQVIYVPQFDRWYIWHGTHWQEDDTFEIVRIAKQTVVQMYAEAAAIEDDDQRKKLIKWTIHSEGRSRLEAMISLLRSEPDIAVRPQDLDQHPMLLACTNGTLDLVTGELLAPDPAHLLTKRIDVAYDPAAECPTWERFLRRIMAGNQELIAFLQRLIGHALTGDTSGKYLVFMYGPKGNNGKSTLVETIMRLLGPYAMKSPTEMVMAKSYRGGIPNDIARLRGVRYTVTNELDEGMTLSESIVKDLTGNDTLTARFMRAEFFDFIPTHKLWIYGNHKPEIRGTDAAIWDRVKLVPFDVEIPKAERDPEMLNKLTEELPGILAWAVRGNIIWRKIGIAAPEIVAAATGEYQREQDSIGQFLIDCCEMDASYQIGAGALYQAYETWAKQLGLRAETGTKFGDTVNRKGFQGEHTRTGKLRRGLRLNEYGRTLGPQPAIHWAQDK